MPGGDRTGPMGMGPRTGRGAGFCAGYGVPGYANRGCGADGSVFGGRGGRGGRGRRNGFPVTGVPGWRHFAGNPISGKMPFPSQSETPQNELETLREQTQYLEQGLKELQARMEALASKNRTE